MSDEPEKKENTVAEVPKLSTALVERIVGSSGKAAMTFDPTTRDGAIKYLQARLKDLPSLKSKVNMTIEITDVFTHDVSREGKAEGEVEEWQRTVVYTKDGSAYTCGSAGVWDAISAFMAVRPQVPWNPPIKCTVMLRELGNGRVWMYLDPDLDSMFANSTTPGGKKSK